MDRAKELSCIAKNMEKYISFAFGSLKFIDSCAFMAGSLDSPVKATPKESLKKTEQLAEALNGPFKLLVKKGVYPYEYMDSFEKFAETSLPPKERVRAGPRRNEAEQAHHLPRREQLLRLGDVQAVADKKIQVERSAARRGRRAQDGAEREKGLHPRGRPGVPFGAARAAQCIPSGAGEKASAKGVVLAVSEEVV